jgi:hypothetical protein
MVTHEREFLAHLNGLASADRYIRFLRDVAETAGVAITSKSLRSDEDVERFASLLSGRYAEKSVENYRSVMRRYVEMVEERGL